MICLSAIITQSVGVPRTANGDEIKKSFRKLAREYHPDVAKDKKKAEEKFKEAAEAYGVLSDEQKRASYDRFGHQGVAGASGAGGYDASGFPDLSDILGQMFGFEGGFAGGGARAAAGEPLRRALVAAGGVRIGRLSVAPRPVAEAAASPAAPPPRIGCGGLTVGSSNANAAVFELQPCR